MANAILALNAGSSSIKFGLFAVRGPHALQRVVEGEVDAIGSSPHFTARDAAGTVLAQASWADTKLAFDGLMDKTITWIENHLGSDRLMAVGHRVVHGGSRHFHPEPVTTALLAELDALAPLAPLHEPHNLAPIRAIAAARPKLPQVACFDTAFHHSMPAVATRFALPREYEAAGVRRYGFHGLSYAYIAGRLRKLAPGLARGAVIAAHLGNGASLCAMRDGRSVDTTMGFTALDGLVMGTRCGNLDPGVILYLEQERALTAPQVRELLYHRSGLLGVSGGIASDMRTLLASGDPRAAEAIELFVFRIAREAGALTSTLGGLDGIVFTAGIGEHAPEIRARVCARLAWLGVELDLQANAANAPLISTPQSRVAVRVIPTDEEVTIAQHTLDTVSKSAEQSQAPARSP
ncbi:MAG: acetate/propionate family kinase [Rhodanobacteraceae bacterium]|nr:MAG: acetate/propionate family kinase [Rhodanobacteraceae bacterium]